MTRNPQGIGEGPTQKSSEPSEAAFEAARDFMRGKKSFYREDLEGALRAAYAVDRGRAVEGGSPQDTGMSHGERDRWRAERNDLRRTLWCVLRAGGGVEIPENLLTAYDANRAVLEWTKTAEGTHYMASELRDRAYPEGTTPP